MSSSQINYIKFKVSIQDYGVGIPRDKINKLFIDFGNLEDHQEVNPNGRGLGLSICKLIVESMGGTVEVTSVLGKGSVFSMTFLCMCRSPLRNGSELFSSKNSNNQHLHLPFQDDSDQSISDYQYGQNSKPESMLSKDAPRALIVNDESFMLYSLKM